MQGVSTPRGRVTDLLRLLPDLARAMQAQRQTYLDALERQPLPDDFKEELRDRSRATHAQIKLAIQLAQEGPAGIQDLAARLGVTKAAVSRLVDRMAARDLVVRERDTQDTRKVWVKLTPQAQRIVDAMLRTQRGQIERFLRGIPEADQEPFARYLARFAQALAPNRDGTEAGPASTA
jgi:DNA-binding MarR family transcriptional regulator